MNNEFDSDESVNIPLFMTYKQSLVLKLTWFSYLQHRVFKIQI